MNIPGWFDFQAIYNHAVDRFPDGSTFVEVGCWMGASAAYLANRIKESNKRINFICVDTWAGCPESRRGNSQELYRGIVSRNNGDVFPLFKTNLMNLGLFDMIVPLKGESVKIANLFVNKQIDFIFIDAAHDYQSVKEDILAWRPKMKDNSIMAGHDYHFAQVKQAVDEQFKRVDSSCRGDKGVSWLVKIKPTSKHL